MIVTFFILLGGMGYLPSVPNIHTLDDPPAVINVAPDTIRLPEKLYTEATVSSQYIFNGARYHVYDRTAPTHQFYQTRDMMVGTLRYDGRNYGPYEMHYDINFNQLIVKHPTGGYLVTLVTERIEEFNLNGKRFKKIVGHPQLPDAIYEFFYEGPTQILCHRKKNRIEKTEDRTTIPFYLDASAYYLKVGEDYKRIRRKKDLYLLFPDKKRELRIHFRRLQIPFNPNKDRFILDAALILDNQRPTQ